MPRIIALSLLDGFGIRAFNRLPVIRFALSDQAKSGLTPAYSYTLATNFRPERDYLANLRAIHEPCAVVVGAEDEVFQADRFAEVFHQAGKEVPVTVVPGVGHITLTLLPAATAAAVAAVDKLHGEKR